MAKKSPIYRCTHCNAKLKPLRYFVNSQAKGRKWIKVGYWCPNEKKFFKTEEIEGR